MNINIEKNDIYSTLTTYLYCNFHMMYTAERRGHTPYLHWPKGKSLQCYEDHLMFLGLPNQYDWFFKQPFTNENNPSQVWTWEHAGWGHNVVDDNLMSQPLSVIRDYYQKHLNFNDATNERGNAIVSKYNIDFSKTIGITWRGTDIYLDKRPRLPIEVYFPFIDDILKDNPDMRIMCTAEEQGILEPLLNRYPSAFTIDEFVSAPNGAKENPEKLKSKIRGYERGLQPVLMVWLFSKCAHYIKNRSSTGAVASWLSSGKIYCLAHEETLSYNLNMNDQVEIEGVKYPLNFSYEK